MSAPHHPPSRPARCADAAEDRDDPRAGSAVPVTRWLLVEQPGPWGRDALTQSRLAAPVAAQLARRAAVAGARVLLVRRHGRAGHAPLGRRHWAVADSRPGSEAVRWGRFDDDDELLADVSEAVLGGPVVPGAHDGAPADPTLPVYLACTHGRHDACCAVRGRDVAAALDALAPGRVWECSHVGGCRFAANVVVLPYGLYYGGVTPTSAAALVEATEAGRIIPDLLRGRSSLPAAVQAAQHHARAGLGDLADLGEAVDALRPLGTRALDDGSVVVELEAPGRVVTVAVVQRPSGAPARLTCAATRPTTPQGWELVSLVARPA